MGEREEAALRNYVWVSTRERTLGKYPKDATLGLGVISPLNTPTLSGLLHQPSPAGTTGGPETGLGTAQVARWVLELPPTPRDDQSQT